MASHKTLSLIAIAFAVALISVSSSSPISVENDDSHTFHAAETLAVNKSNNLVVGNRQFGDKIIYEENIAEKFQISGRKLIVNRTIIAPNDYVITQVRCRDNMTDGTGAEPTITGGGPDQTWVTLRFKSQRWHGIYFNVQVYAKLRFSK